METTVAGNAIVRSPSAEENYGAIAKRDIPAVVPVLFFEEVLLFNIPFEHVGAKHIRLKRSSYHRQLIY
jgi:hypothetical protein